MGRAATEYRPRVRQDCPRCGSKPVESKDLYQRQARHLEVFGQESRQLIQCRRQRCRDYRRTFLPPSPGLQPGKHGTEAFRHHLPRPAQPQGLRHRARQKREGPGRLPLPSEGLRNGAHHHRIIVEKWFTNARIVADRFHVIRLIQYLFMKFCRQMAP